MTLMAVSLFVIEFNQTASLEKARTFAFLSIVFFELFQAFSVRSTVFPSFQVGLLKNRWLLGATLISLLVALMTVYVPLMNTIFGTAYLTLKEFLLVLALSSTGFIYLEFSKYVKSVKAGALS
jgi:Ca2+-transporting ATPase